MGATRPDLSKFDYESPDPRAECKQMTAGELADLLAKVPRDVPVILEGCDCTGEAGGVLIEFDRSCVTILRVDRGVVFHVGAELSIGAELVKP